MIMGKSTSPQREVAGWVFQGNPELFDIDVYFSRQTFIYWRCPRFSEHIQLGMPVFFKRSGPGGGIIARGEVAELPTGRDGIQYPAFLAKIFGGMSLVTMLPWSESNSLNCVRREMMG